VQIEQQKDLLDKTLLSESLCFTIDIV